MILIPILELLLMFSVLSPSGKGEVLFWRKKALEEYLDLSAYPELTLKPEIIEEKPQKRIISKSRPTSKIAATPEYLKPLFTKYANEYGSDSQLLEKIAHCESGFNSQAVNGPYGGMYQFLGSTWVSNRKAMGLDFSPELRFNPEEAIRTTAYKISKDGTGAWPVCGR